MKILLATYDYGIHANAWYTESGISMNCSGIDLKSEWYFMKNSLDSVLRASHPG